VIVVSTFVGSLVDPRVGAAAIVNASNPHVALGSGVSGAIADACGGVTYQDELRAALEHDFGATLEASDCLVTSAGTATAFEHVLHVPAVDYTERDPETGGASGPSRVRACTRAALEAAVHLIPAKRLGVPLLGAGHGGLGVVASADVMLDAIASFSADHPDATLVVCFAVLEDHHASLVAHAAEKHSVPFT